MCFFYRGIGSRPKDVRERSHRIGGAEAGALAARKEIFGTWLLERREPQNHGRTMIQLMPPAGEKAVAGYDRSDDRRSG